MKQGIHLGRPPSRSTRPVRAILLAAGAAAVLLAVLCLRSRGEVEALRDQIESLSRSLADSPPAASPDRSRLVAGRLRLAFDSGVAETLPPTHLLRLVESALPEGVRLESLSFRAAPRPGLSLEATASAGERVTELQRRLSESPLVSITELLEERRLEDGRFAARIQVGLERP